MTRAQRDAEIERAARRLVLKLDECQPIITRALKQMWEKNAVNYRGPNFGAELEALRELLGEPTP